MAVSREDRIRKIIGLLNLADSTSEDHLGDKARKAAESLMNKYAVTEDQIYKAEFKTKRFVLSVNACPAWFKTIWFEIGKLLGCYVVYLNTGKGNKAEFAVTGPEEELSHVEYICYALHGQINQMAYQYFYDAPDLIRSERMPYRQGLADRAVERLEEIVGSVYQLGDSLGFEDNEMMDQSKALIPLQDKVAKAEEVYKSAGHKVKSMSVGTRRDGAGYGAGYRDGDKLELNKGVNNGFKPKQLG